MDYNSLSLKMHEENKGKVEVISKVKIKDRDDLSTAYTPGVAEPCRKIRDNKADVYKYTCKANTVAVVSDGTAVLELPFSGLEISDRKLRFLLWKAKRSCSKNSVEWMHSQSVLIQRM